MARHILQVRNLPRIPLISEKRETAVTVPSTITPETVVIDQDAKKSVYAGQYNVCTDSREYDEQVPNGEQYLIHGEDKVTENELKFRAISSARWIRPVVQTVPQM